MIHQTIRKFSSHGGYPRAIYVRAVSLHRAVSLRAVYICVVTVVLALCASLFLCSPHAWGALSSPSNAVHSSYQHAIHQPVQQPTEKDSPSALSAQVSVENNSLAPAGKDMALTAHIENSSSTALTLTTVLLRTSRSTITDVDTLMRWLSNESPSFYMESNISVEIPQEIPAHQSITVHISVSEQQRGWDTSQYGWGAHGIELLAYADAPDGSVFASDRTVAVATTDASIEKFPVAAAVVCEARVEDLAAAPSALNQLLVSPDTPSTPDESTESDAHASTATATGSSAATGSSSATSFSPHWDHVGMNLFADPVGLNAAQNAQSNSAETSASDSASSSTSSRATSGTASPSPQNSASLEEALLSLQKASLFSTPAYDADIEALAHTNQEDFLAHIAHATEESRNALSAALPSANHYVPLAGSIDTSTLQAALSLDSGTPIISSRSLQERETFYFPDAYGSVRLPGSEEENPALIAHDGMNSLLHRTLYSYNRQSSLELSETDTRAALVAYSAIIYNQAPSLPRALLAMNRMDCAEKTQADRVLSLLSVPWLRPVSLDEISQPEDSYTWDLSHSRDSGESSESSESSANSASSTPVADENSASHTSDSSELSDTDAAQLAAFIADAHALASALPSDCTFREDADAYALALLNQAWRHDPDQRTALIKNLDIPAFVQEHVVVQSASTINMIAQSSNLPLRVHSDLSQPLTVMPVISSPDQRIRADAQSAVLLTPQSSTVLKIPITAQGSGRIAISIGMNTLSGFAITSQQDFHIRLHPQWETRGTAIIAGVLVLIFIIGIIHSLREGRRSRPISNKEFTQGLMRAHHHATARDSGTAGADSA